MRLVEAGNGNKELNYIAAFIAAGLLLSLLFHFTKAFVFGLNSYPHNTFLFMPEDRFRDFINIYRAVRGLDPFGSAVSVYPPFTYLVMLPFTLLKRDLALYVMLGLFSFFVWRYVRAAVAAITDEGRRLRTSTLAFLTYPFLFVFDRANLEALVFIALALFLHYFRKGEGLKSVFWLSCATAMKMYPGAFIVLFLAKRQYRNALYMLVTTGLLTFLSMLVFKGGAAASYAGFVNNLAGFRSVYLLTDAGLQHNLSLFGALRLAYGYFMPGAAFPEAAYSALMVLAFGAVSAYVIFRETELWRSTAVIVLFILIAPQVSFDYKLIHLLLPLTLFLTREKQADKAMLIAAAFAFLCVPKDYLLLRGDISVAVILNPLVILALMGLLMAAGLRGRKTGEAA